MSLTCVYSVCVKNRSIVVRVSKQKPNLPKLNIIAANDALDDDFMDERTNVVRPAMSLSPSPSPIPMDDIDPEIDPDNVVVRGSYTDDDDDDNENDGNDKNADENRNRHIADATKSNALQLDDFTFKSQS